jgi:hypothetical protein
MKKTMQMRSIGKATNTEQGMVWGAPL